MATYIFSHLDQPRHYSPQKQPHFPPQGPQHHPVQRPMHYAPQRSQLPQQPPGIQPYSPQQSQQFQMNRLPGTPPIEQQMENMHIDNSVQVVATIKIHMSIEFYNNFFF